jgi:putative heme-binding domain-containing protein
MYPKFSWILLLVLPCVAIAQEPKTPPAEPEPSLEFNGLFVETSDDKQRAAALYAAADNPQAAQAVMADVAKHASELELRALRNLDRELSNSKTPEHKALVADALRIMALSGEPTTLQYLHKVFDSRPSRRATIATAIAGMALAGKRRPHDWPLLVRSLTVIEGDNASLVLQALLRHRDRATSTIAIRNLIILALKLNATQGDAALKLLSFWTGEQIGEQGTWQERCAAWQTWFAEKHPYLPPATLPVDDPASPHKFAELMQQLQTLAPPESVNIAQGAKLFETAQCIKCHYAKTKGEKIGPDLTKVVQRLTNEEIVESVLFPSQQIFDQYITKRVVLQTGLQYSGLVSERGTAYDILQSNVEKITVPKESVEEIVDSPVSTMPTGLWMKLSTREIADLLAFLQSLPVD